MEKRRECIEEKKDAMPFHASMDNKFRASVEARALSQATEVTVGLIHKSQTEALLPLPLLPSELNDY